MTDTKATDIAARLRAVQRRIAKAAVQFHAAWSNPENSEIGYLLEDAAKDMPDPDALAECVEALKRSDVALRRCHEIVDIDSPVGRIVRPAIDANREVRRCNR